MPQNIPSQEEFLRAVDRLASQLPPETTREQFLKAVDNLASSWTLPGDEHLKWASEVLTEGAPKPPTLKHPDEPAPLPTPPVQAPPLPAMLLRGGLPMVGTVAGGIGGALLGSPTGPGALATGAGGAKFGGAIGGGLGEYLAQLYEQKYGDRAEISPGTIGASAFIGGIIPKPLTAGTSLLKGAATRGLQGMGIGALDATARNVLDQQYSQSFKSPEFIKQLLAQTAIGGTAGFGLGGLETKFIKPAPVSTPPPPAPKTVDVTPNVSKLLEGPWQLPGEMPQTMSAVVRQPGPTITPEGEFVRFPAKPIVSSTGDNVNPTWRRPVALLPEAETPRFIAGEKGISDEFFGPGPAKLPTTAELEPQILAEIAKREAREAAEAPLYTRLPKKEVIPELPENPFPTNRILIESKPVKPTPGTPAAAMAATIPKRLQDRTVTPAEAALNALIPERLKAKGEATVALQEGGPLLRAETARQVPGKLSSDLGFISPKLATSLGGGVVGGVTGATMGDTPEERLLNALSFGGAGALLGSSLGRTRRPANAPMPRMPRMEAIEAAEKAALKKESRLLAHPVEQSQRLFTNWHKRIDDFIAKTKTALPEEFDPRYLLDRYVGGIGLPEKGKILLSRSKSEAIKAGLEPHVNRYLRILGMEHGLDTLADSYQKAIASGNSQEAAAILQKIANDEALPQHYNRVALSQDMQSLRTALTPQQFTEVQRLGKQVIDLNLETLQMLTDSGLINKQVSAKLAARADDYIPLSRVVDAVTGYGARSKELSVGSPGVFAKHLKGSERATLDPYRASFSRYQAAAKLVARNEASKSVTSLPAHDRAFATTIRKLAAGQKAGPGESVLQNMVDGHAETYAVPDFVAQAMEFADSLATEGAYKSLLLWPLAVTRAILQTTATVASPAFTLVNPIKDLQDLQLLTTSIKNIPQALGVLRDWGRNVGLILKESPEYLKFLESGASYSGLTKSINPEMFVNFGERSGIISKVAKLSNAFEEASKMAALKRNRASGLSDTSAVYKTRRYGGSPDFGRRGVLASDLNLILMFANAQIQGVTRNFTAMKENPTRMLLALGFMGGVAQLAHNWNDQFTDSDGVKSADRISTNDRNNYLVIINPYSKYNDKGVTRYESFKLPLGHATKLLYNAAQGIVDVTSGREEAVSKGLSTIVSGMLPGNINVDPHNVVKSVGSGILGSSNPIVKGVPEFIGNYDAGSMSAIVPQYMQNINPNYQHTADTSPAMVGFARALNVAPGPKISPMKLEHMWQSTFGGLGEMGLSGVDAIIREIQGKEKLPKPTGTFQKMARAPITGVITRRFVGSTIDQKLRDATDKFYRFRNKAAEALATKNFMLKRNPQELEEATDLMLAEMAPMTIKVSQELGKIRAARQLIYNTQPEDAEAKLEALANAERALLPRMAEAVKQIEGVLTNMGKVR